MNLLSNSKDALYNKSEPHINIDTYNDDNNNICIRVADNGCGINDNIIDKIFDPFFTTKEVGIGTGLGLGISHDIIAQMRGEIKVSSKAGEGACFTIILPLVTYDEDI
jgi:two-component system, NtrC family, sensor kinase